MSLHGSVPARAPRRVAVFATGGGSNLGALLAYFTQQHAASDAQIVLVVSNRADAGALARAAERGVATWVAADAADGAAMRDVLARFDIEIVVLAGYLKLLPAEVVTDFRGRLLNVHPALLPAFGGPGMYGRRVHAAVLDAGATVSGVTVHFVDEHYDRGAIAAQWPVPVLASDTPETLAARVLNVEHQLLPATVHALACGHLVLDSDGRVRRPGASATQQHAATPHFILADASHLAPSIAQLFPC